MQTNGSGTRHCDVPACRADRRYMYASRLSRASPSTLRIRSVLCHFVTHQSIKFLFFFFDLRSILASTSTMSTFSRGRRRCSCFCAPSVLLLLSAPCRGYISPKSAALPTALQVSSSVSVPLPEATTGTSTAAQWHRDRRRQMIQRYPEILDLEQNASSQSVAVPILALTNLSLLAMSILSGSLHPLKVLLLAAFPGSMLSLWQLQILHDVLHGSFLAKGKTKFAGGRISRKALSRELLFWGSMPSAFGYYLYLKFGHLTHHNHVGDPAKASLAKLFASDQVDFEDGDVLFVAHRMKLKGEVGPSFNVPPLKKGGKAWNLTMSISKMGFNAWKRTRPFRNILLFATSFMYERLMLVANDIVVAVAGRNYFFPNKPKQFHMECAKYCRCAVAVRALLWAIAGWKSLLFLYLSETLWSIPPNPSAAMFVTNHGSDVDEAGNCIPSSSTYAGKIYSLYTLGTNFHCEHHDFPTIPLNKLGQLRRIAPEFYRSGTNDKLFGIMNRAFSDPAYYACMDAGSSIKSND